MTGETAKWGQTETEKKNALISSNHIYEKDKNEKSKRDEEEIQKVL